MVNYVVSADELERTTMEMARSIPKLPPMSVRLNKKGLRLGANADVGNQLRYESLAISTLSQTADAEEARVAFREKRAPVFTGR